MVPTPAELRTDHRLDRNRTATNPPTLAQTQFRSNVKKAIGGSLKVNQKDKNIAPKAQHKTIFDLTTIIVENTQCEVNILLCARVAFMRKVYIKDSGHNYWDTVDRGLEKIRNKADADTIKVARQDRADHGVDNYNIDDTIDAIQEEVDSVIDDGATSTASQTEVLNDNGVDDVGGGSNGSS
ncbi:hypothetical protein K438DRAFT_1764812 [Mycena galopus ATCC 62051]|nr:hypothetical protein K438DRAFT_1764812 [Mycena galopus ATCC 62051]